MFKLRSLIINYIKFWVHFALLNWYWSCYIFHNDLKSGKKVCVWGGGCNLSHHSSVTNPQCHTHSYTYCLYTTNDKFEIMYTLHVKFKIYKLKKKIN